MLLSVYAKAFRGSTADQIREAAASGFEGLELRGDVDGVPLGQLPSEQFADLCGQAADLGLLVSTLALGPIGRMRQDLDGLRHIGRLSSLCGARIRLFSSDRPGVGDRRAAYGEPDDGWMADEADGLRECVEALREGNPSSLVMLEAEPNSIANTVARQARLIEAVGLPDVGYNWDFVNCWMGGEHPWPGPWQHLSGHLYGVHYKGAKADPHDPLEYACQAMPGDDDIPHMALWATWAAVGFDGPVTVDPHYGLFGRADRFEPEPDNPNAEVCRRTLHAMIDFRRRALARLETAALATLE
jgi:sugar phosphate isomerase/epimerase